MRHFLHSESGCAHQNEDALLVRKHSHEDMLLVCALADGQGGQSGGGPASRLAVSESVAAALDVPARDLFDAAPWYVIIGSADDAVAEAEDVGLTTLISLCVDGKQVQGASCGDSAALLIQADGAVWLTENQRAHPPVGSGEAFPTAFQADLFAPWKLLLMSDGVWRFVGENAIARIVAEYDGNALLAALRQAALDGNGGKLGDDFSVILVQSS